VAAGQEKARNFHMTHIDWKMCQDTVRDGVVIPGFYDPAYPEVCLDRTSDSARRKVGFTIHASWPAGGVDALSMLIDYPTQIVAFRDKCNGTLQYKPPATMTTLCYLSVSSGDNPTMQRKIGWRQGLGEASIRPPAADGVVVSAARNSRDNAPGRYNFVIERESRDKRTMHARYSFEIEFGQVNQYYSVFFEGCCRPAELANNAVEILFCCCY